MKTVSPEEIIEKIKEIPPLPQSVNKIIILTSDPDCSAQKLTNAIEQDASMTAKILKMSNSAYYGFTKKISTISHAIMCLGFKTVKEIAISASSKKYLNMEITGYRMEQGALWEHSLICARIAKLIAKEAKVKDSEEVYIAGLLHDIGKIVLNEYDNELFKYILVKSDIDEIAVNEAEVQVLGIDHAMLGSIIAEKWNLPENIFIPTRYHHTPSKADKKYQKITYIVHLADCICDTIGIGLGMDALKYRFDENTLKILGIEENIIEKTILNISEFMDEGSGEI